MKVNAVDGLQDGRDSFMAARVMNGLFLPLRVSAIQLSNSSSLSSISTAVILSPSASSLNITTIVLPT